jgi:putative membrane protein
MPLQPAESAAIDRRVTTVEARTGVQVVAAVVPRSDSYVELPWKAFALGASLAALGVVAADMWLRPWATSTTALIHAVAILGSAATCALLAIFVPPFARGFLRRVRGHAAVKEYAESLFLRHELFRTRRRTAVLILVSRFERRVEILPDTGLHGRIGEAEWRQVIETMAPHLRDARPAQALEAAIDAVERLLVSKGFHADRGTTNELPNRPIEERGA